MLLTTRCSVSFLTNTTNLNIILKNNAQKGKGAVRMIAGYGGSRPIFHYKFRPLSDGGPVKDGGFSVIIYENCVLSFSTYDASGVFLNEFCFSLPPRVLQCYFGLLRNASSWLGATPCDLRGGKADPFASSFAFDGYDPIRVYGMNSLLCEPCGSSGGFFARHLYVLFEDVANLFAESGIRLTMDGFTWDQGRIQPFRKNQILYSSQQGAI